MTCPDLTTAPNFRALGGQRTRDGRVVRSGLVYRAEALLAPDTADADRLAALGIALVCDLRSDDERARAPNAWWGRSGTALLDLDLLAGMGTAAGPWAALRADPTPAGARAAMRGVYERLPRAAAAHVGVMFRRIAAGELPVLIHCTAGKDRTGFVAALLLAALDVRDEDIVADYLASRGRRTGAVGQATRAMVLARAGVALDDAALEAMMDVAKEYLRASFAAIAADYGDVAGYLARAGVDQAIVVQLRERLLG